MDGHRKRTAGGMDHDDRARPVSGEIMSGGPARGTKPHEPRDDVADAQYETLPPAGGDAPARFAESGAAPSGMDFLKTGAAAERGARRGGPLFWLFGLVAVGVAFWVAGGHALVGREDAVAPAPPKTPLAIADVASRVETHGDRDILFVTGRAENGGSRALALPPIEIAVTANDGGVTRYRLGTRGTELKPGDRYSFSSRLEAPGSGVKTVSVAFQEDAN